MAQARATGLPQRHRRVVPAGTADEVMHDWHLMMEAVRYRLQAAVDPALNPPPGVRADVQDCVAALGQLQQLLAESRRSPDDSAGHDLSARGTMRIRASLTKR